MALENFTPAVIFQGEDKDITIRLQTQDGDPFNLTNASEIKVLFANADGTVLVKSQLGGDISPVNAGGGVFRVRISAADSLGLLVLDNQSFEIRVTINSYVTIAQVKNAISVLQSLFPGV